MKFFKEFELTDTDWRIRRLASETIAIEPRNPNIINDQLVAGYLDFAKVSCRMPKENFQSNQH